MPQCNHCDAFVSAEFVRVFADENGRIHACPECSVKAGIAQTVKARLR